jgi:quinol monooxygenase YgiN
MPCPIKTTPPISEAHLETPHFKEFRAATEKMVTRRKPVDAVPIMLGAKAQ